MGLVGIRALRVAPVAGDGSAAGTDASTGTGASAAQGTTDDSPRDDGFAAIYKDYFPFVWRCLRALGVAGAALDDAAQEVFVVVHRRLPEFRGESSLRTWLYAIVRNIAANQRRGAQRGALQAELDPQLPSRAPDPCEHAQDREAADFVQGFLATLDDKKRDVFVLALLEQLAVPEVAETLGIPLNTAYTRLRSVRIELRRALAEREKQP
jgi:RNA polymerase sigma-70 factor (ECF subfamily)